MHTPAMHKGDHVNVAVLVLVKRRKVHQVVSLSQGLLQGNVQGLVAAEPMVFERNQSIDSTGPMVLERTSVK